MNKYKHAKLLHVYLCYTFRVDTSGQGTTEYAILVGVLVVIAILAIISFKGKIQELWDAIKNGIEQL